MLNDLLALSHVPRWAIVDTVREQSVADHTFRVMAIARRLFQALGVEMRPSAWAYILTHDVDEANTGDIPSNIKNALPSSFNTVEFPTPTEQERIIKLADRIEAYTFLCRYGVGPHAERVEWRLQRQLAESCPEEWKEAVDETVLEILNDTGREGGDDEAPTEQNGRAGSSGERAVVGRPEDRTTHRPELWGVDSPGALRAE